MATALATLVARGGGHACVWARDPGHAEWVVEDVHDDAPDAPGQVTTVTSLREAVELSDVVVPALPWGPALGRVLTPVLDALGGKLVVDVCNPYEMTALGPKLAMVVPGGSAAALLAGILPTTAVHLHCFTHVRADQLNTPRPGDEVMLPYVMAHGEVAPDTLKDFLTLVESTGWLSTNLGGMDRAALVEEGGPWAASRGRAGQGLLTRAEATTHGLIS